jgi:MoxR-like ATPase
MRTGQTLAAMRGRDFVLPDDIKHLVLPVLAHRLILTDAERLRGGAPDQFLEEISGRIPVPAPTE